MKTGLGTILLLFLMLGCDQPPSRPIVQQTNHLNPEFLADLNAQPGRFQLIVFKNDLFKIDTITGKAWTYEHVLVQNPYLKDRIRADGWREVPPSYEADIGKQVSFNPAATN